MGSFGFSQIFFASPPPPTSSPSGTNGDRKFWVFPPPPIKNLEKNPGYGRYVLLRFSNVWSLSPELIFWLETGVSGTNESSQSKFFFFFKYISNATKKETLFYWWTDLPSRARSVLGGRLVRTFKNFFFLLGAKNDFPKNTKISQKSDFWRKILEKKKIFSYFQKFLAKFSLTLTKKGWFLKHSFSN